jgi:hypothetical protein
VKRIIALLALFGYAGAAAAQLHCPMTGMDVHPHSAQHIAERAGTHGHAKALGGRGAHLEDVEHAHATSQTPAHGELAAAHAADATPLHGEHAAAHAAARELDSTAPAHDTADPHGHSDADCWMTAGCTAATGVALAFLRASPLPAMAATAVHANALLADSAATTAEPPPPRST